MVDVGRLGRGFGAGRDAGRRTTGGVKDPAAIACPERGALATVLAVGAAGDARRGPEIEWAVYHYGGRAECFGAYAREPWPRSDAIRARVRSRLKHVSLRANAMLWRSDRVVSARSVLGFSANCAVFGATGPTPGPPRLLPLEGRCP